MTWVVKRTETFLDSLRDIRKNKEALVELDKKLKRLRKGQTKSSFPTDDSLFKIL